MNEISIQISMWKYDYEIALIGFEQYWIKMNAKDPINFPLEMSDGEWDEKFMAWLSLKEKGLVE